MGEAKVTILIVSQAFAGVKRLERHKVINKAMKSFLDDGGGGSCSDNEVQVSRGVQPMRPVCPRRCVNCS